MRRSFPRAELRAAVGAEPVRWREVGTRGYGRNTARWRADLVDGRSAFVKLALDETAAGWLRTEHRVYSSVAGWFMPRLLGWHDGGDTFLVLEDLSDAHWPPPWEPGQIDEVRAALDAVHAAPPPAGLPFADELRAKLNGWPEIAADPAPFLSTGVCSPEWLETALPSLREASAGCRLAGEALLHLDVRSDNLCLRGGRAVLVDWNWACAGNPILDTAAWLPSLRLEGGPQPWDLLPDSGGVASLVAGFFASRAGLPPPPTAPTVREFQRRQAAVALRWAARELGLPPPEGPL